MPPQVIYGMRHAATALDESHRSDSRLDLPLSDEGRNELVSVVAAHLKDVPLTCIYSGDLKRLTETAHIIKTALPNEPRTEIAPELNTWDLPFTSGEPKERNKPIVKYLLAHPNVRPPYGESKAEFQQRFRGYMRKQMKEIENGDQKGPILDVFSGSNCRDLSEMLFGDREVLDVDEAGLLMMYPAGDGKWSATMICGGATDHNEYS